MAFCVLSKTGKKEEGGEEYSIYMYTYQPKQRYMNGEQKEKKKE